MLQMLQMLHRHISTIKQTLEKTHRRLANIVISGVVKLISYANNTLIVQATGMDGEVNSNMQHPQEFGFASNPKAGAYSISLFNGGSRDNGQVILIYDPRYSPQLASGDSCQYDASGNNKLWLKGADGILIKNNNNTITLNAQGISIADTSGNQIVMSVTGIKISTPGTPVIFDAPVIFNQGWTLNGGTGIGSPGSSININGTITASGNVSDGVSSMAAMRVTYNGHTHDAPGGTTDDPNQHMP